MFTKKIRFITGVRRVRSFSFEGLALIFVDFNAGTDMQSALNDIQTAVNRLTTLPEDSEKATIKRIIRHDRISRVIVSGAYSEATLKAVAKRIRDGLQKRGIDRVDMFGGRDEEIRVEIEPQVLRRLGLTLSDIAKRIRQN